jgi:hypothetical protein
MDIAGGVNGPVGIGYVRSEFVIPNTKFAEMSSAKMSDMDNAVFFIQQRIAIG